MKKYTGVRRQKNCKTYSYRIHFKLPDGKEISIEKGGFETEHQAVIARSEKIKELVSQACNNADKTFEEVFNEFMDNIAGRPALVKKYWSYYNTHLKEPLGNVHIGECFEYLKILQKKLCNGAVVDGRSDTRKVKLTRPYVLGIKALLTSIFNYAYNLKYIQVQPMYLLPEWNIKTAVKNTYIQPMFAYLGNKHRLLPYIIELFPQDILRFVDLFAGSAVVGINVKAKQIVINERNEFLLGIYKGLHITPPATAWELILSIVNKYMLNTENEEGYYRCREDYNKIEYKTRVNDFWYWSLCLVYFSFNRSTVQHNLQKEYNAPFGYSKANLELAKKKFFKFAEKIYGGDFEFLGYDYKDVQIQNGDFLYCDPPYLITTATYNKDWSIEKEQELYEYLEELNNQGIKWALSNVFKNNGKDNHILREWVKKMQEKHINIHLYYLNAEYSHANFRRKNAGKTIEILLTNY